MIGVVPSANTKRLLATATEEYERQLTGSPGESYLSARGITKESQASFRLGYVGVPLKGDEDYRGRIAIPYLTPTGCVSIRFRAIGDSDVKYLTRPGDIIRPYNVGVLQDDYPTIYVTEGELDCVAASSAGLPTVGFPGAGAWRPVFNRLFRFRRVCVLADGDAKGKEFGNVIAKSMEEVTVISMPDKHDVNSYVLERGPEGLREYIDD